MTGPRDQYEGLEWAPGEQRTMVLPPTAALINRMSVATVTPWHLGDASAIGVDVDDTFLAPDEARELAAMITALADELDGGQGVPPI
jgi:hypothetical protein